MKNFLQGTKKFALALSMVSAFAGSAFAQSNAGSMMFLDYQNNPETDNSEYADIIMNTFTVNKSADSAFFCVMNWDLIQIEDSAIIKGGFCGVRQAKGYQTRTGILTFWDAAADVSYEQACDSFTYSYNPGGQTDALTTSFHIDYAENYWYTSVSRVWQEDGYSKFGFWFLDHTNKFWVHGVNIVYPGKSVMYRNDLRSFVEDFSAAGDAKEARTMSTGPLTTRTIDGNWNIKESAIAYGPTGNTNYTASIVKGANCLTLGGDANTADEVALGTSSNDFVSLSKINKNLFNPLTISKVAYDGQDLVWDIAIDRLPQFAYEYTVTDLATNEVVFSGSAIESDVRSLPIEFTKNGNYNITLILTDIFDNKCKTSFRQEITDKEPVVNANSCIEMLNGFTVQPTGLNVEVPVEIHNSTVEVKIVDKNGNIALGGASFGPQLMSGPQNHSLYLNTYGLPLDGEYYLVASINDKNCISNFSAARGLYDDADPVADNVEGIKYVYSTFYSTLIGFEAAEDVTATVTISSVYGWTVKSETINLAKGLNSYVIDVNSSLSIGQTFLVNIQFNGKNYNEKFIVK